MEEAEEVIKLDNEIITLRDDAKYERRGNILYCLNYAEPGMSGCSMGKMMPTDLALKILRQHKKQNDFKEFQKNKPKRIYKRKTESKLEKNNVASETSTAIKLSIRKM